MIKFFDNRFDYLMIKKNISKEMDNAIMNGKFMSSYYKDRLQNSLSNFTGNKYCLLTKSGTQSLAIALKCLGIKEGDEVVTTSYTFIATLSAIRLVGANPIIIDINKNTWNMDVEKLETVLKTNKNIKCILPVDIFGNPCDYEPILSLANQYGIPVLEDACQSLTAEYKGNKICNVGCNMASVSFYPTKPFGGFGEGGALFTNDENLYNNAKSLLNHGTDGNDNCVITGTNGEFDSLHSIMLLEKMKTINTILSKRNEIAEVYKQLHGLQFQKVEKDSVSAWCRIQVVGDNEHLDKLKDFFETDSLYTKTIFDNDLYSKAGEFVCNQIAHNSVSLPIYIGINMNELRDSVEKYNSIF